MDDSSSTTSTANRYEWKLLAEFDDDEDLTNFILFKIPSSVSTGYRAGEIKCIQNKEHRMGVQRRSCDEYYQCPIKYKILKYDICPKYKNFINNDTLITWKDEYENLNGLHQQIKDVILEMMDKGKTKPKQIHVFLTTHSIEGLKVPKLSQVQGFVIRS